ncbi:hypothetical protein HMPREF1531_02562 [Propionibacterium sp. oral taxon 192 str. F0372]|nr:hypothetical protein HMPREF1531_02562 [Propionibacterium sp. oral taxon 192 str. F0372]
MVRLISLSDFRAAMAPMLATGCGYCACMTGRFAPSPTSQLHLGNLRTALLAWLFARWGGENFLVRIEDLDQQRVQAAAGTARDQLTDLETLGIDWDPPVVHQSERLELYRHAVKGLDVYPCFCTRKEIAAASQAPHSQLRPYPGTCANLSSIQRSRLAEMRRPATRVRAGNAMATVHDLHAGEVSAVVDDFVLFRADGTPAYNLACVVDDGLQRVTQVCRGDDLLESAPRQGWLAHRLGFPVPGYVHVSLAVNSDGVRLAKRDKAVTLAELTALGASPATIVGVLCESAGLPRCSSPQELLEVLPGCWWSSPRMWQPWIVRTDQLAAWT